MPRSIALLSWTTLALFPTPVQAADPAPAPSQRLAIDPDPPRPAIAGTVDVLGPLFGAYEARLDAGVASWAGVRIDLGADLDGGRWSARALVGASLWPLGRGLRGPWAAVGSGVVGGPGGTSFRVPLQLEAGVLGVWGAVAVGLSAAAERDLRAQGAWLLRIGLRVGWVAWD